MTVRREGSHENSLAEDILECGSNSYRLSYFALAHLPYEPKAVAAATALQGAAGAGARRVRHMGE